VAFEAEAWESFFASWFSSRLVDATAAADAVVPSPLMPNLLAGWIAARLTLHRPGATLTRVPVGAPPLTPWQRTGADESRYVSFATWMCPINCIEPARCPETRGPRDWSMPAAVHGAVELARSAGQPYDVVAMFRTTHRAYGVGMFDVTDAQSAELAIERVATQSSVRVLVASVSHCHGALAELRSVRN
jgi:hypothetical protein